MFGNQTTSQDGEKVVSAHDNISISIRGFHVPIQAGKQSPIASHPFSFWSVVFFSQDYDHRKQIIIEALGSFYTGFSIDKQFYRSYTMLSVQDVISRIIVERKHSKTIPQGAAACKNGRNSGIVHFHRMPHWFTVHSGYYDRRKKPIGVMCQITDYFSPYLSSVKRLLDSVAQGLVCVDVMRESDFVRNFSHLHSHNVILPSSHLRSNCRVNLHGPLPTWIDFCCLLLGRGGHTQDVQVVALGSATDEDDLRGWRRRSGRTPPRQHARRGVRLGGSWTGWRTRAPSLVPSGR